MKIKYVEKALKPSSLRVIEQANAIIREYQQDGMALTLRQLYYQFVARDLIPNRQTEYKRLGNLISDGRLAGLVDWYAIEDRTRNVKSLSHWDNPGQIIRGARYGFRMDKWAGQAYHVEVWIEKEALAGVISTACTDLDVSFFACRGYVSQSEMWAAAERFRQRHEVEKKQTVIVHLGDMDPSGIDMTRDIEDRMRTFGVGDHVTVERIALNYDQVQRYDPPPNPAKITDSRANGYIAKYGRESWELDALEPRVMRTLIKDAVEKYREESILAGVLAQEQKGREVLKYVEQNWQSLIP